MIYHTNHNILSSYNPLTTTPEKSLLNILGHSNSSDLNLADGSNFSLINHRSSLITSTTETENDHLVVKALSTTTSLPDLVIENAVAPTIAAAGSTIQISYTEKNIGGSSAGWHYVDFYLSKDNVWSTDDSLLSFNSVSSLGAGASVNQSVSVTLSNGLTSGTYYLLYVGDSLKQVTESNENNNVAAKAINITSAFPDLVIENVVALTIATIGTTIQLSYTEKNIGGSSAGWHYVDFYLSKDNLWSTDDSFLSSKTVSSLGAGASVNQSVSVTLSNGLTSGTYYLLYVGDSLKQVAESNENNNVVAKAITLTTNNFNSNIGYGLINAAAAVANTLGQSTFADVLNLGGNNWGADLVKAPEVWAKGYTGQGVIVAVLDTGVDYNHPDLKDNIWLNTKEIAGNGKDDDGNGFVDDVYGWNFINSNNNTLDVYGHGTHTSGTIAGVKNNFGVTGIAYNAKIMPVKVLDDSGSGSYSAIVNGIYYAVNNGAKVLNLSFGGNYEDSDLKAAVQYASSKGAIVVMAAGNNSNSSPSYPARYADNWGLAVGAVDKSNTLASFSNKAGSTPLAYVTAPGVNIYSTLPNSSYGNKSGTSMATPHVAGVVALMLSAKPGLTDAQVRQIIINTAVNSNSTLSVSLTASTTTSSTLVTYSSGFASSVDNKVVFSDLGVSSTVDKAVMSKPVGNYQQFVDADREEITNYYQSNFGKKGDTDFEPLVKRFKK
ncbi:MAG TPA: S8 family serine peptidase [Nostocaceae cyanobacterium]|nr:S8 family serine peptidase [Nostocaceae cyanobacterium]